MTAPQVVAHRRAGCRARDRGGEAAAAPRDRLPLRVLRRRAVLHGLRRAPRLGLRGPAAPRRRRGLARPAHARHLAPRDEAPLGPRRRGARPPDRPPGPRDGRRAVRDGPLCRRERPRLRLRRDALPLHDERVRAAVLDGVRVRPRPHRQDGRPAAVAVRSALLAGARPAEQVLDGRLRLRPRGRRPAEPGAARLRAAVDLARRGARLPGLPAERDLERPARLALLRADAEHPRERARRRARSRRVRAAAGPQHEPRQPAGLARRPRLAALLRAGPPLPAPRLGVPGDARDVRGHEGQGLLPGPRLRHPLRRGRRRHRGLHGRRLATVAAAGPPRAPGPDAALPAPQPADPARRPADRLPGAARLDAARHREGPRASGPAAPLRLAVRLGRDGGGGRRRVPRDAAGGAGAGRDHRQQLRRFRGRSTCSGRSTACR